MNARAQREIDDIVDDIGAFVAEVRREHGDAEAGEFIGRLAGRINEMAEEGKAQE